MPVSSTQTLKEPASYDCTDPGGWQTSDVIRNEVKVAMIYGDVTSELNFFQPRYTVGKTRVLPGFHVGGAGQPYPRENQSVCDLSFTI